MAGRRQYGAIRKLPSGRWQARHRDRLTNRLVPAPHTFKTKSAASSWLASAEAGALTPAALEPTLSSMTLAPYAWEWLHDRDLRPRTRELYASQLRRHIIPQLGEARISKLQPADIRKWHGELGRGHLSQVSVAKVYRLLRAILTTAVEDGLLVSNPCQIKNGGTERSGERPIPTIEEAAQLANAMPERLQATVWVAAIAGLRKGEILGLTRDRVDLEVATIVVDQALQEVAGRGAVIVEPKTSSSYRSVAVPEFLVAVLAAHLQRYTSPERDALVFTNQHDAPVRSTVWAAAWSTATTATGLEGIRFHDLRHLAGTLAAQAGATLKETMERLGHSTSTAALRYQHVASERDRVIAGRIGDLL